MDYGNLTEGQIGKLHGKAEPPRFYKFLNITILLIFINMDKFQINFKTTEKLKTSM